MAGRTLEKLQKLYNSSNMTAGRPNRAGMGRGPGRRGYGGKPQKIKFTVARLFSYLRPYRWKLILALCVMLVHTACFVAGSYLLRPIVNNYIAVGKREGFFYALLVLAGIFLCDVCAVYVQSYLIVRVSQNMVETLRNELFAKLQKLPVRFFDTENSGDIMSRFTNDIDQIDALISNSLVSVISGIISMFATLFIMIKMNIWLTLITLLFIPFYFYSAKVNARYNRKYHAAQQASLGAVNGYIVETVSGQKVVKVFNHEDICREEFQLLNRDLQEKQMKSQFYGGIMGPVVQIGGQFAYALTAGIGGIFVALGHFDVGGLAVFVNYARRFSMPILQMSMHITTFFSALAGAERVFRILDCEEEGVNDCENRLPGKIEGGMQLEHVTFGYHPDKVILKDISLYAKPGQKIAFVGSTGAGKTTITSLLNRFYEIQDGKILLDGVDIREIPRKTLRRNIAMVLQDTHLFTGTVMENIRYGRLDATDEEVIQAAKTASAHGFITRLDQGYQTVLQGDGVNLSEGQRQLLNIARAAVSRSPILVLDEATSSVDTRTERLIEKGMDALMKNSTTFVIAHRLSTVRNADAIMVLEHGEIVERGNHEQLLNLKGRYYELYTGKVELE